MTNTAAPHIRTDVRAGRMMVDVLLALIPLGVFAYVNYGLRPLILLVCSMATAVVSEALCCIVARRPLRSALDGTSAITGMLIGLVMSPITPYWVPMLGSAFAIIVAKAPFGGSGRYVFNPAAAGLAILSYCFPLRMFVYPSISGKNPLPLTMEIPVGTVITESSLAAQLRASAYPSASALDLLLGDYAGPIGTTATLITLAFLVFLMVRRTVSPWIALPYFGTCVLIAWLFPLTGLGNGYNILAQLCSGYVLFAGVFLIHDPVTAPRFWLGRLIYGIFCAILTMLLQRIGRVEAGSCFAVLLANALAPIMDRWSWHFWYRITRKRRIRREVKAYE